MINRTAKQIYNCFLEYFEYRLTYKNNDWFEGLTRGLSSKDNALKGTIYPKLYQKKLQIFIMNQCSEVYKFCDRLFYEV